MPQSPDAEESTLGGCLHGTQYLVQVIQVLGDVYQPFYGVARQEIWEAMLAMFEKGIAVDIITLSDELAQRGSLTQVGGSLYLSQLLMKTPTAQNAGHHARLVVERAVQRMTAYALLETLDRITQPGAGAFLELEAGRERLHKIPTAGMGPNRSDGVTERDKILARVYAQALDQSKVPVIRTGIAQMDRALGGWRKGELIVIAGRPGSGKTALATSVSMNATGLGLIPPPEPARVCIMEYEMAERQIWNRVIAALARLNLARFDDPQNTWTPQEQNGIQQAVKRIEASGLFIDTVSGHTEAALRRRCEYLVSKQSIQMFVLDQSNKVSATGRHGSRSEEVEHNYKAFKQMAKDLDVPVIAINQLNRQCELRNPNMPRPQLSDLRESGGVEQESDLVLMTFRPEDYGIPVFENGDATLGRGDVQIEKSRNGKKASIRLAYIDWLARWESIGNSALYSSDI